MHNEPDGISDGEHPNPSTERLIPYQEFLNAFVNNNIDSVVNGGFFIDWADRTIDRHTIIGCISLKNLDYKGLKWLLNIRDKFTIVFPELA